MLCTRIWKSPSRVVYKYIHPECRSREWDTRTERATTFAPDTAREKNDPELISFCLQASTPFPRAVSLARAQRPGQTQAKVKNRVTKTRVRKAVLDGTAQRVACLFFSSTGKRYYVDRTRRVFFSQARVRAARGGVRTLHAGLRNAADCEGQRFNCLETRIRERHDRVCVYVSLSLVAARSRLARCPLAFVKMNLRRARKTLFAWKNIYYKDHAFTRTAASVVRLEIWNVSVGCT